MFKCFKKNRIFKRQASLMLVFAMLISMLTFTPMEVQARSYSGQYYNRPEPYTNLVYNGKAQRVFSFAGDSWEGSGGWFADTTSYGGHTGAGSFTLTNAGTYNLYVWFWSSRNSVSKQQGRMTVTISKANQAIDAPTIASYSGTTIKLNAIKAGQGATTYGYSTSKNTRPTSWQSSTTFTGLNPSTTYYFFAKYAGNTNYNEAISVGTTGISWTYTLGTNVLKATCTTVGLETVKKLKLVTPAKQTFTENNASDFYPVLDSTTISEFTSTTEATISDPTYYSINPSSGSETQLVAPPNDEGYYKISYIITAPDGKTYNLSKVFEIGEEIINIEPAPTQADNYLLEPLNNLSNEEGHLLKRVAGSSEIFNGMHTDLRVELLTQRQPISVYKIADIVWDASTSTYSYPVWNDEVDEWINDSSRSDDFKKNLAAYATPFALSQASSDIQDAFFKALAADATLLSHLEKIDTSEYSTDNADDASQDEEPVKKHYAFFRKLTFGTYLIHAGSTYNPVVKNIIPDEDASGYTIPTLIKASLKGGGIDLVKKINGHDIDTVAVGDTVSFEISFDRPSASGDRFILTDIMSTAFELTDLDSIVISTNSDGSDPLPKDTYYTIDPKVEKSDDTVSIKITFISSQIKDLSAEKLYVKYDAIVTKDIKYNSEENINTAKLQIDSTIYEDTVRAYTYGLNIIKRDGTSADSLEEMDYLPGAEFNLFKEKYYYINDEFVGAFDEISGMNYAKASVEAPADGYIEECVKHPTEFYVYEYEASDAGSITVDGESVYYDKNDTIIRVFELVKKGSGFFDDNGTIKSVASEEGVTIGGLNSGYYILVETKAPFGYHTLLEDIYFEINRLTEDEAKLKTSGSLSSFYEMGERDQLNESGKIKIEVLNYKGLTLPSTGGVGTLLFTIIGIVMMMSVLIILVVRRHTRSAADYM